MEKFLIQWKKLNRCKITENKYVFFFFEMNVYFKRRTLCKIDLGSTKKISDPEI